jgi:hypothetical protein
MHDPKTVAFEIKNPFVWVKKGHYRPSLITIWHVDPENFKFPDGTQKQGGSRDDSCGWSRPMYHISEWEAIKKLAKNQYSQIFERQVAESEGKDYAYVCNQPETTYELIYWIWRSIKAHGKKGWQFGRSKNFLSPAELEYIMILATNPVDNFKHHRIKDEKSFIDMFRMIWSCYLRFNRPWYRHPRWHVHHWQIQFVFWRDLKRRYWDKCCICGKRGFKTPAHGDWSGTKRWHGECQNSNKVAQ